MATQRALKIVIINRSDATGGAAVVSMRLLEALREQGVDARMLVAEKKTASPHVAVAASEQTIKRAFLAERLKIFAQLHFKKENLFKIDTASQGLPIATHPWVKEADVVCLSWVNQGMLTFGEIKKIHDMGKPLVWTMHDLWPMVGICHYPYACTHFREDCGECPLLPRSARSPHDLSNKIHAKKSKLYSDVEINFVAISRWVAQNARESSLLGNQKVLTIPNPYPIQPAPEREERVIGPGSTITLIMGAARLDVPIKGLSTLVRASHILAKDPDYHYKLVTYGGLKDPAALAEIAIEHEHLGYLSSSEEVSRHMSMADIVASPAHYETWGATLAEGQVNGAVPVAFNSGGQTDIIDDGETGILVDYTPDPEEAARRFAAGVRRAIPLLNADVRRAMRESVHSRFSYASVAEAYISLFRQITK